MLSAYRVRLVQQLLKLPPVQTLGMVFELAGEELYLVGGCVRDALSSQQPADLDFATNAHPDRIMELVSQLGSTWDAGAKFGTIGVMVDGQKVEITTFRADAYDGETRKPEVVFGESIEDDLLRRDFTLNAIAVKVPDGLVIDPFGGADDLETGTLRTPTASSVTIREDPLRALRAIRFAITRDLAITQELFDAIKVNADLLEIVSQERKTAELLKIAIHGPHRLAAAHKMATNLGVTEHLFGAIEVGWSKFAQLPTAWSSDPLVSLAAVSVDMNTSDEVENCLLAMKFANADARRVAQIVSVFQVLDSEETDHMDGLPVIRRLIRRHGNDVLGPALAIANAFGHPKQMVRLTLVAEGDILRGQMPVNGDDFVAAGLSGPAVGAALKLAEKIWLSDPTLDHDALLDVGLAA